MAITSSVSAGNLRRPGQSARARLSAGGGSCDYDWVCCPASTGRHKSIWQLCTPDGQSFGTQYGQIDIVAADGASTPPELAPSPTQILTAPATAEPAVQTVLSTWNRYGGLLQQEAARLDIHPGIAVAVLAAESRGEPFDRHGRLIIRFENHIFYEYWGKANTERFRQHFAFAADESWKGHQWRPDVNSDWQPMHHFGDQDTEWRAFEFARTLNEKAAMYAISMGAPQIMGFNHTAIGYPTVQAMFADFSQDVRPQLISLFRFMEVNGLVEAVRNGDFLTFARIYNGTGQATTYQQIIQQNLASYQKLAASSDIAVRGAEQLRRATARLPQILPQVLPDGRLLSEADPELYAAWRKHIEQGFENNQTMFSRILAGFMNPYWITVTMYAILFAVGIISFAVAVILGLRAAGAGAAQAGAMASLLGSSAIFGGLSVVAFLTYFISRPLQALEENLQFITWLGIIYNTYWTRLAYIHKLETVQVELEAATGDAIAKINALMDKHEKRNRKRPTISLPGGLGQRNVEQEDAANGNSTQADAGPKGS
ncbi:MAG: N-acetylmuramidase domain-containing protein [Caldilineaceae bacterium]